MPRLAMEVVHALGREEAGRRLKEKFSSVKQEHGDQVNDLRDQWEGNTFSFGFKAMGMKVEGTVSVEEDRVTLDAKLPLAAMMFKAKIQRAIREELGTLLS